MAPSAKPGTGILQDIRRARRLNEAGQKSSARDIISGMLERHPNHPHVLCQALRFGVQDAGPEEIGKTIEDIRRIRPNHPRVQLTAAALYLENGNVVEASELLELSTPSPDLRDEKILLDAKVLLARSFHDDGLRRLSEIHLSERNGQEALTLSIETLLALKRYEQAQDLIQQSGDKTIHCAELLFENLLDHLKTGKEGDATALAGLILNLKLHRTIDGYWKEFAARLIAENQGTFVLKFLVARRDRDDLDDLVLAVLRSRKRKQLHIPEDALQAIASMLLCWSESLRNLRHDDPGIGTRVEALILFIETRPSESHKSTMAQILDALQISPTLTPDQLKRLMQQCIGSEDGERAVEFMRRGLEEGNLNASAGMAILRNILSASRGDQIDHLTRNLSDRIRPSSREEFNILANAHVFGSNMALKSHREQLRRLPPKRRVRLLALLLVNSGHEGLAYRYLNRFSLPYCQTTEGIGLLIDATITIGKTDHAARLIDTYRSSLSKRDEIRLRVALVYATSGYKGVKEVERNITRTGPAVFSMFERFVIALRAGDLNAAEQHLADARNDQSLPQSRRLHFSRTFFGKLRNELRLTARYGAPEEVAGNDASTSNAYLQENFFFPARDAVDRLPLGDLGVKGDASTSSPIPKRIMQYWDTRDPPDCVEEIMHATEQRCGWDYTRFNRQEAIDLLKNEFEPGAMRAFRLARNRSEEADFIRLCLLYFHGGIYLDADNRLHRALDPFVDNPSGVILFRDDRSFGEICVDCIAAAPRHPIIGRALDMAEWALRNDSTEGTWLKTGPALLTRAVASFVSVNADMQTSDDLGIFSTSELRPFMSRHINLPYKKSTSHWNYQKSKIGERAASRLVRQLEALKGSS